MRVLWFTNIPMPGMLGERNCNYASSGGWMIALLERLSTIPSLDIVVVCVYPKLGDREIKVSENLKYYPIRQGPNLRLFGFNNLDNDPHYLAECVKVVQQFQPDIIHIHGTERFYGLLGARKLVTAPIVISLQGLLHDYARYRNYFGVTSIRNVISTHKYTLLVRGMGPIFDYLHLLKSSHRELEIIRGNHWFMGRSEWDHSHLAAINPDAQYFYVNEILRSSFYEAKWNLNSCERHRIIFTNASDFRRGIETLLDALEILKHTYPNVRLALAGDVERLPYAKVLNRRITSLGIQDAVEYLGNIDEKRMLVELCKAHVFAIASLIENSPNSLCEAQLVGMPCVASNVGGIPSLIDDGRTGLLFNAGDAYTLASKIRRIFRNDEFAKTLGIQARQVALSRHDPDTIARATMIAYQTVIDSKKNQTNIISTSNAI